HGFASARQLVPEGSLASAGHAGPEPVQFSATSQSPAAPRHSVVAGSKPSVGQTVLDPVHVSVTSQTPAGAGHVGPAFAAGCWQAVDEPSHSSTVHGFASVEHVVPAGSRASPGQLGPVPGQLSAGSHSPAEPRHSVVAGSKPSDGQSELVPSHDSATSQMSL